MIVWRVNIKELSPSSCRGPQLGLSAPAAWGMSRWPSHWTRWSPCSPTLFPPLPLRPEWATIPEFPRGLALGLMVHSTYAQGYPHDKSSFFWKIKQTTCSEKACPFMELKLFGSSPRTLCTVVTSSLTASLCSVFHIASRVLAHIG